MDGTEETTPHTKPPLIYVVAQIIKPLIELLNYTVGTENYILKQIKLDQIKIQTNTLETFRKVIQALKLKNAAYHTYQLKTEKTTKQSSEAYVQKQTYRLDSYRQHIDLILIFKKKDERISNSSIDKMANIPSLKEIILSLFRNSSLQIQKHKNLLLKKISLSDINKIPYKIKIKI